ncbi:putative metallo-dependent phosphatase [Cotonvirus japonicus]|uniref:Metallo-dependent phosphatase n=1 Tax=Cotonvirus japonicus TaxID=2811091 RepID=A0ABM7NT09_9VIRU|nr:putative metallo-dependent phosphatase [Cotonvirus japonicus]BCS83308.1 putative metallo-dependent phosphatase [Cotonvirus japonicus]
MSKKLRILRYVSDLHLEFLSNIEHNQKLKPLWEFKSSENDIYYLALIGDIGNPFNDNLSKFLNLTSKKYSHIFYVPGNHEYYNLNKHHPKTKSQFDEKLRDLCNEFTNVNIMNNSMFDLDDVLIVGSTLWSHIPDDCIKYICQNINDYHLIKKLNPVTNLIEKITAEDTNLWNKESIEFLDSTINNTEKPCIILTHHAPLYSNKETGNYTANPCYVNSPNNHAFHNDLTKLIKQPVIAWLYGHTHYTSKFMFNNVIIATNQLGYNHESIKFDIYAHINIDDLLINSL